jgi:hypothetical protein
MNRLTDIWTQAKAVGLAGALAVLVWLYAEGESLASRTVIVNLTLPTAAAPLPGPGAAALVGVSGGKQPEPAGSASGDAGQVSVSSGEIIVQPDDPSFRGTVRIRLEGTSRSLDDALARLGTTVRLPAGTPGIPSDPGERRTLDILQALNALPELQGLGSSVADVEPRFVSVRVRRLMTREVPVRVELQREVLLDGEPAPAVAMVQVRFPESALGLLGAQESALPPAVVTLSDAELRGIRGDGPQTVMGSVRPPTVLVGMDGVQVAPENMSVLLRVRRKLESTRLATVPVWFSLPPTEDAARWSVEVLDKFLPEVTLSGPSDEIARIASRAVAVKALVEIGSDELERGITSKSASFTGLPAGVTATAPSTIVRVRITRRPGDSSGTGTAK